MHTCYTHTHTKTQTHTPTRIANYLQNNEIIKLIFLIHLIEDIMKLCYFLARRRFQLIDTDSKRVRALNTHTRVHTHTYTHAY